MNSALKTYTGANANFTVTTIGLTEIPIKNLNSAVLHHDLLDLVSKTENLPKNAIYKICLTIIKKLK